jgi:hypothetical protein
MAGNLWIVNSVLAKELHTTDEDCLVYTTTLMDKLEQVGPSPSRTSGKAVTD